MSKPARPQEFVARKCRCRIPECMMWEVTSLGQPDWLIFFDTEFEARAVVAVMNAKRRKR